MRETRVEREYLKKRVEALGGLCRKFTSPGHAGVPDRICILPKRVTWYVEVKKHDGTLSPGQFRELERYWSLGHHTAVAYGIEGVDELIRLMEYSLHTTDQQYRMGY